MTDITLHGSLSEILQHHAMMVDKHLTVTVHMDAQDLDDVSPEHLRIRDETHLEQMLIQGLDSGPAVPVTEEYWKRLSERIEKRAAGQ